MKETQGHRKMRQYIEDLMRNKHFLKQFKRLQKELKSDEANERDEILNGRFTDLWGDYMEIEKEFKRLDKRHDSIHSKIYKKMASVYGLDNDLFQELQLNEILGKEFEFSDISDFCQIIDNSDEYYSALNWPPPPPSMDFRRQRHYAAYPVSISIHQFATKRDLLDFVEKRWILIEERLEDYRRGKMRFRSRKIPRKISDFLWSNRQLKSKPLKNMLDEKFPKNGLAYYEIYKIIEQESLRRNKKFIVGQ